MVLFFLRGRFDQTTSSPLRYTLALIVSSRFQRTRSDCTQGDAKYSLLSTQLTQLTLIWSEGFPLQKDTSQGGTLDGGSTGSCHPLNWRCRPLSKKTCEQLTRWLGLDESQKFQTTTTGTFPNAKALSWKREKWAWERESLNGESFSSSYGGDALYTGKLVFH